MKNSYYCEIFIRIVKLFRGSKKVYRYSWMLFDLKKKKVIGIHDSSKSCSPCIKWPECSNIINAECYRFFFSHFLDSLWRVEILRNLKVYLKRYHCLHSLDKVLPSCFQKTSIHKERFLARYRETYIKELARADKYS